MSESKLVMDMIEEHNVQFVDLRFTDPRGKWQHTAQHVSTINDDFFETFSILHLNSSLSELLSLKHLL